ncbi:MAG: EthD family reductase [Betaproteobacteria bacterium]
MIKVSVMYPNAEGAKFDFDYYSKSHMPLIRQKLGEALKGVAVEKGLFGAAGASPAFIAFGHLYFESLESFRSSFGAHAETFRQDVPNFTDIAPTFQISEVLL